MDYVLTLDEKGVIADAEGFFPLVEVLSDKFEPSGNFAREEAYFELKKCTINDRREALNNALR